MFRALANLTLLMLSSVVSETAIAQPTKSPEMAIPEVVHEDIALVKLQVAIHRKNKGAGSDEEIRQLIAGIVAELKRQPDRPLQSHDRYLATFIPAGAAAHEEIVSYVDYLSQTCLHLFQLNKFEESKFISKVEDRAILVATAASITKARQKEKVPTEVFVKAFEFCEAQLKEKKNIEAHDESLALAEFGLAVSLEAVSEKELQERVSKIITRTLERLRRSPTFTHEQVARCLVIQAQIEQAKGQAAEARKSLRHARDYLSALLKYRETQKGRDWEVGQSMLRDRITTIEQDLSKLK